MPRGRMLNKKISQDSKIARLSIEATLLYTWCIPHLDIKGRIYGDIWTLKAIVPYIKEITPQRIEKCIEEWVNIGLVEYYGEEQKYLEFKGFDKNQTLREDRESPSEIPSPTELQQNSGVTPAQVKLSKVKLREVNIIKREHSPLDVMKNFLNKGAIFDLIVSWLKDKKIPDNIIQQELNKFTAYWTEPNKSGTKQRWEMEKTFELKRRLSVWFGNYSKFNKGGKKGVRL